METKTLKKIKLCHFQTSPELAEVKVSYRSKQKSSIKIKNSKDAFNVLFPLYDKDIIELQEQFYLLLLNRMNSVIGWIRISAGGTSGTVVDPKILFALALQGNAAGIVISHNHPSGNLQPSQNDINLTHNISNSAKMLEIKLLDHIIVTADEMYYSFADDGCLY